MAHPRKKNYRKAGRKTTRQKQLDLPLATQKVKTKAKIKRVPKKQVKTKQTPKKQIADKRSGIMLIVNVILCFILLFLIFSETAKKTATTDVVFESDNEVAQSSSPISEREPEKEDIFLNAALNQDEIAEDRLFQLETKLREKPIKVKIPDQNVQRQITSIDTLGLSDDELYELYEESQPEENLAPQPVAKPDISHENPLIAIVIDDMGVNVGRTRDIISLKYPLSASFLTYANNLPKQIAAAKESGHEIMAHLPMEPQVMQNFTPTMLTTQMNKEEIITTLQQMLALFPEIKAVNNHMGSKFTEDGKRMEIVMQELAKRNITFLDSVTTQNSVAPQAAQKYGVTLLVRDVFLDNKDDFDYIIGQLHKVERIAENNGYAIAIGHPKAQTYRALKAWLPTLEEKGIKLVPLSKMVDFIN